MSPLVDALIWLMDQVGYAICHQFSERSLAYGGRVLPVCARDAGLFLGFSVCFAALLIAYGSAPRRYPSRPKVVVLALFIVPMFTDAVTSYAGLRSTTNTWRLATGSLAGAGFAALVFPAAVSTFASSVPHGDQPAAFRSWWSIAILPAVPAGVTLLLLPDWTGAYWLWAPLVTLSIVFTLLVLNFLLVSYLLDWLRAERGRPTATVIGLLALACGILELVISNRLHWLVERHL